VKEKESELTIELKNAQSLAEEERGKKLSEAFKEALMSAMRQFEYLVEHKSDAHAYLQTVEKRSKQGMSK